MCYTTIFTLILSFFPAEKYCGKSVKQLILPFEEVCDTSYIALFPNFRVLVLGKCSLEK